MSLLLQVADSITEPMTCWMRFVADPQGSLPVEVGLQVGGCGVAVLEPGHLQMRHAPGQLEHQMPGSWYNPPVLQASSPCIWLASLIPLSWRGPCHLCCRAPELKLLQGSRAVVPAEWVMQGLYPLGT